MDDRKHETPLGQVPAPLLGLGTVLIVAGVVIGFYVAREALAFYRQTEGNLFINALISRFKDTDLLTFADHPLAITEQGATIVAFTFFILLALFRSSHRDRPYPGWGAYIIAGLSTPVCAPQTATPGHSRQDEHQMMMHAAGGLTQS